MLLIFKILPKITFKQTKYLNKDLLESVPVTEIVESVRGVSSVATVVDEPAVGAPVVFPAVKFLAKLEETFIAVVFVSTAGVVLVTVAVVEVFNTTITVVVRSSVLVFIFPVQ